MADKRATGRKPRQHVSNKTLRLIHYYNDDGFIHYVSEVLQGADCRVADVVRSLKDVTRETVGILPESVEPGEFRRIQSPGPHQIPFAEEAVRVSLALPTWLNNIWMNSPLRDSAIWSGERTRPPGVLSGIDAGQVTLTPGGLKARWEADRLRRRRAWEANRALLPLGVQV